MDGSITQSETAPTAEPVAAHASEGDGGPSEEQIREALRSVVDPELGINIVDLGLVYEIDISPNGLVHIDYTLTTMGCPIGPLIEQQMQAALAHLGVTEIESEMVLRPPWSPEMMSEEAKAALGYF